MRIVNRRRAAWLILALLGVLAVVPPVSQAFLGAFVPYILRVGAPAMERAVGVFFKREAGKLVAQPLTKSLEVHGSVVAALGLSAFNWPADTGDMAEPMRVEICHTGADGRCTDDLGSGGGSASGGVDDFMGSVMMLSTEPNAVFANTDPEIFEDTPSEVDPLQPAAKENIPKPGRIGDKAPSAVNVLYNEVLAAGGSRDYDYGTGVDAGVITVVASGPLPEYEGSSSPCGGPDADVPPGDGYTKIGCYGNAANAYSLWRSPPRTLKCPEGYENFGSNACILVSEYDV